MKKFLAAAVILLLSVSLSSAQSTGSYNTTLKKMIKVAGTEAAFSTVIKQMLIMFKQQHPQVPENVWTEFSQEFSKTSIDDLAEMLSPVYQKHFSEEDLIRIIAFYETPIGRKLAEKTPIITQESMQAGQQWGMKIAQRVTEKLKAQGY